MGPRSDVLAAALVAALGAVVLYAHPAQAYCQMATCSEKEGPWKVCAPQGPDDCGAPIVWRRPCTGFSLQRDASSDVPLGEAKKVFEKAFDAWTRVSCDGQPPSVQMDYLGTVQCDEVEYNSEKANANVIAFRDDEWPHDEPGVLALTTVTYSLSTGEIYDADMEINTAQHHFTIGDKDPDIDLLSVATHEAGHFLGLAHSTDSEATMFAAYAPGTTGQRSLAPDDVAGICAAYSPDAPAPGACDPTPRHGFSSLCAADQTEETQGQAGSSGEGGDSEVGEDGGSGQGGEGPAPPRIAKACAAAPLADDPGPSPWTALLGLTAFLLIRRRRTARRSP